MSAPQLTAEQRALLEEADSLCGEILDLFDGRHAGACLGALMSSLGVCLAHLPAKERAETIARLRVSFELIVETGDAANQTVQ